MVRRLPARARNLETAMTAKAETRTTAAVTRKAREPTEKERANIAKAREAKANRSGRVKPPGVPPKASLLPSGAVGMEAPHSDADGYFTALAESLGVESQGTLRAVLASMGQVRALPSLQNDADAQAYVDRCHGDLALLSELGPRSALEALLSVQMIASHEAAMRMSAMCAAVKSGPAQADYANLMNKTMRTFTAQVEALHKLRTGGKQQVEVRYVYVDARTQTVINPAVGGGKPGGAVSFDEQPYAPGAVGSAVAAGLPMWGEDSGGYVVPFSGGEGEEALSDARREEPRRSQGRSQRQLPQRLLDAGNDTGPPDGQGAGENVS